VSQGGLEEKIKELCQFVNFGPLANLVSNYQRFEKILIAIDGGALGLLASSVRQAGFRRIG